MKSNKLLIISIVLYRQPLFEIQKSLKNILEKIDYPFFEIHLFDNGNDANIKKLNKKFNFFYYSSNKNIGFSKGHNFIISKNFHKNPIYLILNPDIYFETTGIAKIISTINKNKKIGLISPKLLNLDGSIQDICRLIPSPLDLVFHRIGIQQNICNSIKKDFFISPFIHGACFFIKNETFLDIGLFDEKFFLYMEDLDLCRRISEKYDVVYFSRVVAYHSHQKGSAKNIKLLIYHIISAIKYFNKWGWFFDQSRKKINITSSFKNLKHSYVI
jgi:GT2 family glycosyltransferase